MLNIYIANLGKYNEARLVGDWIQLPCSEDELNDLFVKIKLGKYIDGEYVHGLEENGVIYEEYAIHDYETDINGVQISEYSSISHLNEIAEKLDQLDEYDSKKVQAIMEYDGCDLIEAADHIDNYILMEGINNHEDLGYYWLEESGCYEIPENLRYYIDYEKFGRDIDLGGSGTFTEYGWLEVC